MAAFEAVSKIQINPIGRGNLSVIDFRSAELPEEKPPKETDDFDPYDYREPENPINISMAYFNLIRTVFGAGMLGMPLALSQSGILLGTILLVTVGILILHMHLTLLRCLHEISRQMRIPYISYRYGFRIALLHGPALCKSIGKRGPAIIATFMIMSQLGICTVFVAFTSDNLRDIMDWDNSRPALYALLIPYILLEMFMKTLKIVSYVSLLGNLLNLIGLILVFYQIFYQLLKEPQGKVKYAEYEALPLLFAYGTMLFNLSTVGVIMTLDRAMSNPRALTKRYGVLTIGMLVPTAIATIFGVLGYWCFGTMEENILRSLPYDEIISMIAIGLYLVAVAFAFPIQCYPAIQIIIEVIKNYNPYNPPSDRTLNLVRRIANPCFVLLAFGVCYMIPFQAPFVAFVGHLCTTMLALIFPALMELCIRYPDDYGKYKIYLVKNLIIIIVSLIFWIFGVVLCGYLIYVRLLSLHSPNNSSDI